MIQSSAFHVSSIIPETWESTLCQRQTYREACFTHAKVKHTKWNAQGPSPHLLSGCDWLPSFPLPSWHTLWGCFFCTRFPGHPLHPDIPLRALSWGRWPSQLGEALLMFLREWTILPLAWISSSWLHSEFVQYWFLSSECLSAVWLQLFLFGVRFGVRSVNTYCQHLICVPFTHLSAVSLHNVYTVKSRCFLHPGLPPSHPFNVLRICSTR